MKEYDAITDIEGIKVGHWSDFEGATGCTVVLCEQGATPGVDVRGSSPGTYETDLLRPGYAQPQVNAIFLAGGGVFGLGTGVGVTRWCEERGIGLLTSGHLMPFVSGAVISDLSIGKAEIRPDAAAGYAACEMAHAGPVEEGTVGAGTGATIAKLLGDEHRLKGGIGTASEEFGDGLIVAALVAVNAVGDIIDRHHGVIAAPVREDGSFFDTVEVLRRPEGRRPQSGRTSNTTIGVIATNVKLSKEEANRLASLAHDGLARTILPVHTSQDGDTMFALSIENRELPADQVSAFEALSSIVTERAVIKAVRAATSLAGVPSVADMKSGGGSE